MKTRKIIIPILTLGLMLTTAAAPGLALQEKSVIPQEVKDVLEAGMATREARADIPFSIIETMHMPAQQNLYGYFFFELKNSDIGYGQTLTAPEGKLEGQTHAFFTFKKNDGSFTKDIYAPINCQIDAEGYDPEANSILTTGYPLPPGDYLLAMAITTKDLTKIGTQYFEFSLPDPAAYASELGTSSIIFTSDISQMPTQESKVEVHNGYMTYSVLKIVPNLKREFSPGGTLDSFFFVLGAQANQAGRFDIEINYEVKKGEETVIQYSATKYQTNIISQPLPLEITTLTEEEKDGEKTEKKETKDLEAGSYTFLIKIKDITSGKTTEQTVPFDVK